MQESEDSSNTNHTAVWILLLAQVALSIILVIMANKFPCLLQIFHALETFTCTGTLFYQLLEIKYERAASFTITVWMLTTMINYIFYSCRYVPSLIVGLVSLLAIEACCFHVGSEFNLVHVTSLFVWFLVTITSLELIKRRLIVCLIDYYFEKSEDIDSVA